MVAKLWYIEIKNSNGTVTIDDVPPLWKSEVQKMIDLDS